MVKPGMYISDDRYEIIEKIGNGGMATVYRAKCHVLKRDVAVKILRDEFTTDEEFIKRFGVHFYYYKFGIHICTSVQNYFARKKYFDASWYIIFLKKKMVNV